jgi:hypothetical protein
MRPTWIPRLNDLGFRRKFGFWKQYKIGKRQLSISLFEYRPYADFVIKIKDSNVCKSGLDKNGDIVPMGKSFTFYIYPIYFSIDFWIF